MVEQLQQSPKNKFKMESIDTEKSAILLELNDKSQQLADLFRGLINVQGEEWHRARTARWAGSHPCQSYLEAGCGS